MENQNQNPRAQLVERLKQANNVLVTVSSNPSVDQLSAAIGLTLMLNALDKHATAVFSGEVPSTLEFLKPETTLERTTDSLRDFIISLDKSKADKLRYKVEDKMVKIFITPYRTSLTEADLIYEQGDFNVDVIVAIGVHEKEELDQAITSHGRILHDATIATVNTTSNGQIGSINWVNDKASSLCEMLAGVSETLKPGTLDSQMATAFLTGIVAETARFSNEKTSSDTMNISAKLMGAGANQQLVATQLEQQFSNAPNTDTGAKLGSDTDVDGSLEIAHGAENQSNDTTAELPEIQPDHVESDNEFSTQDEDRSSRLILEPPSMGGKLTANTEPEHLDPSTDPMTVKENNSPMLSHRDKQENKPPPVNNQLPVLEPEDTPFSLPPIPIPPPVSKPPVVQTEQTPSERSVEIPEPAPKVPSPPEPEPIPEPSKFETPQSKGDQTLTDLEMAVDSPHIEDKLTEPLQAEKHSTPDADEALAAAHQALEAAEEETPPKPADFNASAPMDVHHEPIEPTTEFIETPDPDAPPAVNIDPETGQVSYPTNLVPSNPDLPSDPTAASVSDPTAPPPGPPPMIMPPLMPPPSSDSNSLPPINT